MTTNSWVGGSLNQTPGGVTCYLGLFNCGEVGVTEVNAKMLSAAGTYRKMSIQVTANGGNTATLTFRKNGADGSQTISIGSGATGWFQDTTHSDTVVDGDLVNLKLVTGSGITYKGVYSCQFETASAAVTYLGQGCEMMGTNFSTGNQDKFLGGIATLTAGTEVAGRITTRAAGTYSKLSLMGNTAGQVPHTRLRINGADGALDIAEGAGTNGVLQTDSTHSDAVVSGDTVSIRMSTTGTSRWAQASVRFVSSDTKSELVKGGGASNIGSGTTYHMIMGTDYNSGGETTEANANAKAPTSLSLTKLRMHVGTNALVGGSQVYTSRINAANGALTITIPVTTTGLFEDTTHTDGLAAGDLYCIQCVGSNSSGSVQGTMAILVNGATSSTLTGDGDMEFSGITLDGAGANRHTGTAAMEFTGISMDATAEFEEHGTATMEFIGIAIAGAGVATHIKGTADMEFGSLEIVGAGKRGEGGAAAMLFGLFEIVASGGPVTPAGTGLRQFWTFG